mmetsp:Transcript_13326/g.28932  ORF Transcript_13326/g.28932 Transcript_13326/m.28932 type:complete len:82 (-) Transcript_13326:111-356(-)
MIMPCLTSVGMDMLGWVVSKLVQEAPPAQSASSQTPAAPADSPYIKKVKDQACRMKINEDGELSAYKNGTMVPGLSSMGNL